MMQGSLPMRLRVLRAERGLTLREAATLTGVRPGTLSELERGRRHPNDVTLAKVAEGYGISVEELFDLTKEPLAQSLDKAYCRGWDDAEKAIRGSTADLLERSGKERAELEARIEQLERIGKRVLKEYEKEEEEYGFPFNFALRDAHRELGKALEED